MNGIQEVVSSILSSSTRQLKGLQDNLQALFFVQIQAELFRRKGPWPGSQVRKYFMVLSETFPHPPGGFGKKHYFKGLDGKVRGLKSQARAPKFGVPAGV